MASTQQSHLTQVEQELKARFDKDAVKSRIPSTADTVKTSERVNELVLPPESRSRMPLTKDKYLVRENPHLVEWERVTREFLRNLSPDHGHRVAAVMIYEWATGMQLKEVMELQKKEKPPKATWRADMRKLDKILEWYFGKPYMTWICGRKIPRAYRVPPGYFIRRHRPMTLTLWAEYTEGVLYP